LQGLRNALARLVTDARVLRIAMAFVAAGVLMRLAAPFMMDIWMDGHAYAAMGHSFALHGEFIMPWGGVAEWACGAPTYSHHYPPFYPMVLGAFYEVLGFGLWQTKLVAVLVSLGALATVWACTKDLFDRNAAWLVAGLVAVEPQLVWATGTGFTENLVLLLFTVTLWAILKSLEDERWMVVAGAAAGLAYLTRAGMGAFFLVAGLGGLAWRFYYMRWAVLRSKWYLAGAAVFGTLVALWALRNIVHFGAWETSAYTTRAQGYALDNLDIFGQGLAGKFVPFVAFLALYFVPFLAEAIRGARRIRREEESALWLAVVLVFLIGWILASLYWTIEQFGGFWWTVHLRYLLIATVPIYWIAMRHRRGGTFGARYTALGIALLLMSGLVFAEPTQSPEARAIEELDPLLFRHAQVGVEGLGSNLRYALYTYAEQKDIFVYGCFATGLDACPGQDPDFIVSLFGGTKPGYDLIDIQSVKRLAGDELVAFTYARSADNPPPQGPRAPGCVVPYWP
jgi:4-amino-4-deoxy-L-arabinose transferase-like glycosyltransferase